VQRCGDAVEDDLFSPVSNWVDAWEVIFTDACTGRIDKICGVFVGIQSAFR
jgi:hypothetical protein